MNWSGFQLPWIVMAVAAITLIIILFKISKDSKEKVSWITTWIATGVIVLSFSAVGIFLTSKISTYTVEGTVNQVDTHGKENGFVVLDTDVTNKALVVQRKDLPAVSSGDFVKLKCHKNIRDKDEVYYCTVKEHKTQNR